VSELPEAKGHHQHPSDRQRLAILQKRLIDKLTAQAVADLVGVSKRTVDFTVHKWHDTHDVHEHVSGGHDFVYDDNDFYKLECLIDQADGPTAEELIEMMGSSSPKIDVTTMRRYRHLLDYTKRKPADWVIDTERTSRLRQEWALKEQHADHTKWVFMDETNICLRHTGDIIWIKRGTPAPRQEVESLKCAINVWGIIWEDGCHFEIHEGSMTSEVYVQLLEKCLSPLRKKLANRTILLDQHPAHHSNVGTSWIETHSFKFLFTPPHSLQFNAIEEVWA
jgi:hypothetical protein